MGKGKVGEGKIHIIILYRGNLSERGKRGFAEKGQEITAHSPNYPLVINLEHSTR